jgi:transmembrane sensor
MNHENPLPHNQDDYTDISDLAKNYIPKEAQNNEDAWNAFKAKLNTTPKHHTTLSVTYRRIISYAAVIALLIVSGYMYFQPQKETPLDYVVETTGNTEFRKISLADGSTVFLAPNSTLHYSLEPSQRKLKLSGHARFEVARNEKAPFTVEAQNTLTSVLGTGFDINAYPNADVKVFVNHGKVKVETSSQEIILTKNQSVLAKKDELMDWDYQNNPLQIQNGALQFENARLDFVIETLNQYYHIQLQFNSPQTSKRFSGTLHNKQSAEEIAKILSAALQLNINAKK